MLHDSEIADYAKEIIQKNKYEDKIQINSAEEYKLFMDEIQKGKEMTMTIEVKEESKVTIPETHEDFSSIKPLLIIIIILLSILTIGIGILIFGSFRDRCHGNISDTLPFVPVENPNFDIPNWQEDMYQIKKPKEILLKF